MKNKTVITSATLMFATAALLVPTLSASAAEQQQNTRTVQATSAQVQPMGTETRRLLNVQRSGAQASRNQQFVSGSEMLRIYQRYLNSFEHRIPEFFIKAEFTAE